MKSFLSVRTFVFADLIIHVISERIRRLVTTSAGGLPPHFTNFKHGALRPVFHPAMSSWVLATACPRGDCCVHRAFHEVLLINSALYLRVDCWYTNVAIWNTRSIPCIQISNDFKFPTILCSNWRCSLGNMRYLERVALTPLLALMVKGAVLSQPRSTSAAIRL